MMQSWEIKNDRVHVVGEQPYLGIPYEDILRGKVDTLPPDFDGYFPFMRMCNSIGDYGIVSGLFEAMKKKYPNCKVYTPSQRYLEHILGRVLGNWKYSNELDPKKNMSLVFSNNPYIDGEIEVEMFTKIFTDHDRSYTSLVHDGEMVRSCDEPLCEQILRRFGFTDDDLNQIDSRPKLYFSEDEIQRGEYLISKYVGEEPYGCLLFASRLQNLKGEWEKTHLLYEYAEDLGKCPVFFFSEFDIKQSNWSSFFPERIDFSLDKVFSIRLQMYIKYRALFNLGYQAGITDSIAGGGSRIITLCPHRTIRENVVRGVEYIFFNGSKKKLPLQINT